MLLTQVDEWRIEDIYDVATYFNCEHILKEMFGEEWQDVEAYDLENILMVVLERLPGVYDFCIGRFTGVDDGEDYYVVTQYKLED
jgi:hypothetical protein